MNEWALSKAVHDLLTNTKYDFNLLIPELNGDLLALKSANQIGIMRTNDNKLKINAKVCCIDVPITLGTGADLNYMFESSFEEIRLIIQS